MYDEYGPGMEPGKFARNIKTLSNEVIAGSGGLPKVHGQLSEGQLLTMWVELFAESNPRLAPYFANLGESYRAHLDDQIDSAPWQPINAQFHDRQGDVMHRMRSEIVPARHMPEPTFSASYGGKSVHSHSRMNGMHVSDLALTKFADANRGELFRRRRAG